ncbi:sn1-specific diacylglycerol lipase beta-like isoform X2 [Ostrinia furnacalis]|nr:sn1-specific diacylglycerol lipase beta-like isoform X2 [Ostrinia furnacalis]XP_028159195.1 sn1-specific diacylglycerol lipase beta-like isoform X2 [Ostrinia furnacalis]XP_028159196.1 sn1-specific diacylglycerol lipase beta-like isoform X2 [Ostrinia furnacalis]XP_028159197.1 sn1-specific diacylglycerol lipase beta-like isoform X2 [Ostrinia furnacalis]
MPALRLLGRRWMFASDDLVFPSILEIPYRLTWLLLLSLVLRDSGSFDCRETSYAQLFVDGCLMIQVVEILLLVATAVHSARGSLTNEEPRRYVGHLLICKLFFLIVEMGLLVMGNIWVIIGSVDCQVSGFTKTILQCIVILSWIPMALMALAVYFAYDPLGTLKYEDLQTPEERDYYHKKFTEIWESRLRWTFWYFKDSKMKEAISEMASLLSILFRSSDLVLYDLIAGSILLRVRQKRESRIKKATQPADAETVTEENEYTTDMRKICADAPAWMTVEEAQHYLKYATAAYGGLYVLYRYYCAGFCFLLPYLRCCCWRPRHVKGDNCCMCNYAGLKYMSDVADKDFLFVSFENHIFEVPFYVIAEHERRCIVVTVRGSISIPDMFTDLAAPAHAFQAEGLPEGSLAHKGMALGTEKTLERLAPILERAFAEYPDYELVITGHSLGAAISTLLGIKLKPKYPHLKVFAFSTPSGLLSRDAARYTEGFVMTVGVGDDLVMRISLKSAQMFRDRLLETMHATNLPKYRILLKGLRYMFFTIPETDLNTVFNAPTDDIEANLIGPTRLVRSVSYDIERMYIAGRILHIVPHKPAGIDRSALDREPKYKLRWANAEDFAELVVTPSMLVDHMPENVLEPLQSICSARLNNIM